MPDRSRMLLFAPIPVLAGLAAFVVPAAAVFIAASVVEARKRLATQRD